MYGIVMKQTEDRIVILCEDGSFRNIAAAGRHITLGERIEVPDAQTAPAKAGNRLAALRGRLANGLAAFRGRAAFTAAAAALFIVVMGLTFLLKTTGVYADPVALVAVDINPSVELYVDARGKINKAALMNDDAKLLVGEDDLKGEDLYEALQRIIRLAEEQGYLNAESEKTFVLLSVLDLGSSSFEVDKARIKLPNEKYSVELYYVDEEERDTAQKRGLTVNKYIVAEQAKEMGVELNEEQLKSHSVVTVLSNAGVSPKKFFEDTQASDKHKPKNKIKSDKDTAKSDQKKDEDDPQKDDDKYNQNGNKNDDKSNGKNNGQKDDKSTVKWDDDNKNNRQTNGKSDDDRKSGKKDDKSDDKKNEKGKDDKGKDDKSDKKEKEKGDRSKYGDKRDDRDGKDDRSKKDGDDRGDDDHDD